MSKDAQDNYLQLLYTYTNCYLFQILRGWCLKFEKKFVKKSSCFRTCTTKHEWCCDARQTTFPMQKHLKRKKINVRYCCLAYNWRYRDFTEKIIEITPQTFIFKFFIVRIAALIYAISRKIIDQCKRNCYQTMRKTVIYNFYIHLLLLSLSDFAWVMFEVKIFLKFCWNLITEYCQFKYYFKKAENIL